MERITKAGLHAQMDNVNRRLDPRPLDQRVGAPRPYVYVEFRNGYVALDEYKGATCIRTLTAGTKREVHDFLHAMMVGIDLSRVKPEAVTPEALEIDTSKDGWFTEYEKRTKA